MDTFDSIAFLLVILAISSWMDLILVTIKPRKSSTLVAMSTFGAMEKKDTRMLITNSLFHYFFFNTHQGKQNPLLSTNLFYVILLVSAKIISSQWHLINDDFSTHTFSLFLFINIKGSIWITSITFAKN